MPSKVFDNTPAGAQASGFEVWSSESFLPVSSKTKFLERETGSGSGLSQTPTQAGRGNVSSAQFHPCLQTT
eukprot:5834013-Heterocapsa_arctica.AAC.1